MTALKYSSITDAQLDRSEWGRISESAVGAHLLNSLGGKDMTLEYWREGSEEVDLVLTQGEKWISLEVKTSRIRNSHSGLEAFRKLWRPERSVVVGTSGIPIEGFLLSDPGDLF